ncbi:MAG TPA: hypothetical protein VMR98_04880, partial [Candidatus Polarisedimenticolaceae bacterium]|nr:hypothetical protein [Candidatus Polarisedimenticolaceae bacterium]
AVLVILLGTQQVFAETLRSPNFTVDESFVGGGGQVNGSSTNFKADSAVGETGIGNSTSTGFQTNSGYITTSDPALTFVVNTSVINFGALSASATATATSTFSVINYTSYGYVVQTIGPPPGTGSYVLNGMSSSGPSQTGVEQYGINLRANTSPVSFGANPGGGVGVAVGGYNSPDNFKYVTGDTIASAPKSSGQTNFTISYIVNASNTTRGGTYTGTQSLICTGTY